MAIDAEAATGLHAIYPHRPHRPRSIAPVPPAWFAGSPGSGPVTSRRSARRGLIWPTIALHLAPVRPCSQEDSQSLSQAYAYQIARGPGALGQGLARLVIEKSLDRLAYLARRRSAVFRQSSRKGIYQQASQHHHLDSLGGCGRGAVFWLGGLGRRSA